MSIDVNRERLLTVSAASKSLPEKRHTTTIWRWFQHGCRGVRLESVLIGGRRYTSKEAIQRFILGTSSQEGRDDAR